MYIFLSFVQGGSLVGPLCQVVTDVRDQLRAMARQDAVDARQLLQLCDAIRDTMLPPLGVRLEDKEGHPTEFKLCDPEELSKEIEAKKAADEAKKLEKQKKKELAAAKAAEDKNKFMEVG